VGVIDDCPFPVGRGSNAVQATFNCSTFITSIIGFLYIWLAFLADLFFMLQSLGWNALRHWGQIISCYVVLCSSGAVKYEFGLAALFNS